MANASFNNPKRLLRVPSPVAHAAFQKALVISALLLVIVVLAIMLSLAIHSFPSLKAFGFTFFFSKTWDPVSGRFGALVFLIGTLLTSFLALLICLPFSLAIGIFIGEYHREGIVSSFLKQVTELLAGIPSVIYGFWGLFVFVPVVRNLEMKLGVLPYGVGIFAASVILSVMVVPYAASIGREVISMDFAVRSLRNTRRHPPCPGQGSRRDDGGDYGDWQRKHYTAQYFQPGEYYGQRDCQRVHGGHGRALPLVPDTGRVATLSRCRGYQYSRKIYHQEGQY